MRHATGGVLHPRVGVNSPQPARSPYHEGVDPYRPAEDERGVDIAQIRRLLALTPAERIREMVQASNVLIDMNERGARQLRT